MRILLEITQLENGDIVLREVRGEEDESQEHSDSSAALGETIAEEPLVRIRFSDQVREMLGGDLAEVAEAMIDAATDYLGGSHAESVDAGDSEAGGLQAGSLLAGSKSPIIH